MTLGNNLTEGKYIVWKMLSRKNKVQTCVSMLIKIVENIFLHVNQFEKRIWRDTKNLLSHELSFWVGLLGLSIFSGCWVMWDFFLSWGLAPTKYDPSTIAVKGTGLFCRHCRLPQAESTETWSPCSTTRAMQTPHGFGHSSGIGTMDRSGIWDGKLGVALMEPIRAISCWLKMSMEESSKFSLLPQSPLPSWYSPAADSVAAALWEEGFTLLGEFHS